jgi:hypothetical protein
MMFLTNLQVGIGFALQFRHPAREVRSECPSANRPKAVGLGDILELDDKAHLLAKKVVKPCP